MESQALRKLEREYTLSQIHWKRSLTDVDMKRRRAAQKERSRLQIDVINQINTPTLRFEVEQFKLFGNLRKTETECHNTMPSWGTISAEKGYIAFEETRRRHPHAVHYNNFHTAIEQEARKSRTPLPLPAGTPDTIRSRSNTLMSKPDTLRSRSNSQYTRPPPSVTPISSERRPYSVQGQPVKPMFAIQ